MSVLKKTDWKSMWISIFLQFLVGVQISVYYMSMWPYLSGLDSTADMDFLGWIVAACSIGATISTPIYGYWNQKTMSVKYPAITGFIIAALGQLWYGLLYLFPTHTKWIMLSARLLTGLGVGNISAIRVYAATASTEEDRMRAISFGTAGFVSGVSFGPVISAVFTPLAAICIYLFTIINIIATNIEVMSTPLTTVLYDWKDSDAILYNGIIVFLSCAVSVAFNMTQGMTRLGDVDKRIQMLLGTSIFLLYNLFMYPWPIIYEGPLNFIPRNETSMTIGGCLETYTWCNSTTRVPQNVYIFCFIVFFGLAFPFIEAPSAALYSEVLGPRKQGTMQGIFSMVGNFAPVIGSLVSTSLFQHTGYKYVILFQTVILLIGAGLIFGFYRRLVPLKVVRNSNFSDVAKF
ncbi:unnamed protein product [Caenorhabditis angaria]|uniref:Major facilitator superfamily (MFS) profile domain-containing protein n=1 Tax=Caenorhabditis angaria TaxID=860376 RepID=A0A9P1ITE9_9PELO|nr:unnamed protein product [Caenorhabditis angaria]